MTAIIMDGKKVSREIEDRIKSKVENLKRKPGLGVILVGENPASQIYVRNKQAACGRVGIISKRIDLPNDATQMQVIEAIESYNNDDEIDGILLQLPMPSHLNEKKIMGLISKDKEVDGFHLENLGKLLAGHKGIRPCTPKGIIRLLEEYKVDIQGKNAVVLGRSTIVGKPVALLLLEKNATVTICHSKTVGIKEIVKKADIIVAAIGKAKFVTEDMVKHNAVVVDVGINRVDGKLVGDVDFEKVSRKASYITPVPGGIGPMTIASLLENTMELYEQHEQL
ncbi:MAG TPA: bifunctional methylenetetrahydrofolate dehydrogenase/methenyltetrahydrofolate cyclohydrolase FolD [Candidatus Nanoarchaeia archaeon]|nr:bifunctional methylenetetrahydrofolate dehydrogenase/methenyltetrahydrofolate cyclohydrolase FolD [Candidatus Nanoarchaeia archaeon]